MSEEPTLEKIIGEDFRWPKRGDRLFQASSHWFDDAEIPSDPSARQYFMVSGYKEAGDRLVDATTQDRADRRGLIYPIIFCYRQFIELSLKAQISDYGYLADIPKPKRGHDLKYLLKLFRKMSHKLYEQSDESMIVVSKCILEFARMDRTSFTFRYAANNEGEPYNVHNDRVDLARLKDVMDGLHGFFTGSDGYFSSIEEAQSYYYSSSI